MKMLVKEINIKTLNTGDKSGRITLETLEPEDTAVLAVLHDKVEIDIQFEKEEE